MTSKNWDDTDVLLANKMIIVKGKENNLYIVTLVFFFFLLINEYCLLQKVRVFVDLPLMNTGR